MVYEVRLPYRLGLRGHGDGVSQKRTAEYKFGGSLVSKEMNSAGNPANNLSEFLLVNSFFWRLKPSMFYQAHYCYRCGQTNSGYGRPD